MLNFQYSKRIFIDKSFLLFLNNLSISKPKIYYDTLKFLSIIKTSSMINTNQNVILLDHFNSLKNNKIYSEHQLKYICKPINLNFNNDSDQINVVKEAISLLDNKPFKIVILTDSKTKEKYVKSPYLSGIKDITIFADNAACSFISSLFYQEFNKPSNYSDTIFC